MCILYLNLGLMLKETCENLYVSYMTAPYSVQKHVECFPPHSNVLNCGISIINSKKKQIQRELMNEKHILNNNIYFTIYTTPYSPK